MPQYGNPLEALFAGVGAGLPSGTSGALKRKYDLEDESRRNTEQRAFLDEQRQARARERFALADAGEREGSASQVMDVFNFQSQPNASRSAANADLSMLLQDNPTLASGGAPGPWWGENADPNRVPAGGGITPNAASGMTSDPIREALMARLLPREKKQFAPRSGSRSATPSLINTFNSVLSALKKKAPKTGIVGRLEGTTGIGVSSLTSIVRAMNANLNRTMNDSEVLAVKGMLEEEVGAVEGQ